MVRPERIVVLRGGGLGDLVFALPALAALAGARPEAEICLVGHDWMAPLTIDRPGPVDRLLAMPDEARRFLATGAADPSGRLDAFVDEVASLEPDVAVQLHGGGRHSNALVRRFGAGLTIGLRAPDAPALDRTVRYVYYQSEVMRGLEVVGLLGARPVTFEPRLTVTDADRDAAATALSSTDPRPIAVLHPGASDPRRRWPTPQFAAVADRLADAGARIVIVGSSDDTALARDIDDRTHAETLDLAGRLDLSGLVGVLSRANVVVANDSGPLHLAAGVGAATVGIFWCGNLINAGPAYRARHRPQIAWRLACPVCGTDCTRARCPHDASFVADVPTDDVAAAALELLEPAVAVPAEAAAGC